MCDQSACSQGHQHLSRLTLQRPRASALPKSPCASPLRLLLQTQMTHTPQGKEHRFLRQHTRQPFLQKDFLPCRQDASIFVKEGIVFPTKKIRPLISAYLRRTHPFLRASRQQRPNHHHWTEAGAHILRLSEPSKAGSPREESSMSAGHRERARKISNLPARGRKGTSRSQPSC